MQLLADMTQVNKTRKKTKELLAQEQKKFEKLERVPEENRKVTLQNKKHLKPTVIICYFRQ